MDLFSDFLHFSYNIYNAFTFSTVSALETVSKFTNKIILQLDNNNVNT